MLDRLPDASELNELITNLESIKRGGANDCVDTISSLPNPDSNTRLVVAVCTLSVLVAGLSVLWCAPEDASTSQGNVKNRKWIIVKHCTSVHTWQRARVTAQQSESCLKSLQKVEHGITFRNGFCNLSRNVFGFCKVCHTVQCFV